MDLKRFLIWKVGEERLYGEDLEDCLQGKPREIKAYTAEDAIESWAGFEEIAITDELFFGRDIDEQAEFYVVVQEVGNERKFLYRADVTLSANYWPVGVEEISV